MIADCHETVDVRSTLFCNSITTHLFLEVADIYKLSKLATTYTWYKIMYNSDYQTSLAKIIIGNNEKYISKIPKSIVNLVKELVELFKVIEIPEVFKEKKNNYSLSNLLEFTLVSKKLLNENTWKVLIPFTNLRSLISHERDIQELLADILNIVYDYPFATSIVYPLSSFDIEISPIIKKAYSIVKLPLPILC
jgi:hypothetical protein